MTLDETHHYKRTSTQGATLNAQAGADGVTRGTIATADGKRIAPGGTHRFGRSGNVREGQPGRTIIGLDKKPRR